MDIRLWIYWSWGIFLLIWISWGLTAKRSKQRQSIASRAPQAAFMALAFWMLFNPAFRVGPLSRQLVPHSSFTNLIAVALTAGGLAIAIWARWHLGRNWSATVTVKQDHSLIRTGPYALVRHPIYTGTSMMTFGLAVLNGDLRSFVALGLIVTTWILKIRLEEQFMRQEFGTAYLDYKRDVKGLIPFIW